MKNNKEQQEQAVNYLNKACTKINSLRDSFAELQEKPGKNGKMALSLLNKLEKLLQRLVETKKSIKYFQNIHSEYFSAECNCNVLIANIESHLLRE